jgi:hypothetical protein
MAPERLELGADWKSVKSLTCNLFAIGALFHVPAVHTASRTLVKVGEGTCESKTGIDTHIAHNWDDSAELCDGSLNAIMDVNIILRMPFNCCIMDSIVSFDRSVSEIVL